MFDSQTFFLDNYRAPGYIAAGIKNIWNVGRSLDIRLEGYAFSPFSSLLDVGNQEARIEKGFQKPQLSGMLAVIYETLPGPISVRINYLDGNSPRVGVMLSFGYLIFNERSYD